MEVDYGVGVILAKLKELNIHQNTLVFFSSDNGAEGIAGKNGRFNWRKCYFVLRSEGWTIIRTNKQDDVSDPLTNDTYDTDCRIS